MRTKMNNGGWIGVDLDGTLARNDHPGYPDEIGPPVERMVNRIRNWLSQGKDVRIVTARAANEDWYQRVHADEVELVNQWVVKHIGVSLPIQAHKDHRMIELWDDRAVAVEPNTGKYVRFRDDGTIKSH